MASVEKAINGLKHCTTSLGCFECPYSEHDERTRECQLQLDRDALEFLKEQKGLTLALEQANATINYLNEEKENAIKEIEECKAFNLKCDGQPKWLRKGIDVGLNTALYILKGKDGET